MAREYNQVWAGDKRSCQIFSREPHLLLNGHCQELRHVARRRLQLSHRDFPLSCTWSHLENVSSSARRLCMHRKPDVLVKHIHTLSQNMRD